jgi:hypothetical protein
MHPFLRAIQVSTVNATKAFGRCAQRGWNNRQVTLQNTAFPFFAGSTCLAVSDFTQRVLAGQGIESTYAGMSALAGGIVTLGWQRARDVTRALRDGPADAARYLYTRHLSSIECTDKPALVAFAVAGPMLALADQHQGNTAVAVFGISATLFGIALGLSAKSHQHWIAGQIAPTPVSPAPQPAHP